MAFQVPTKVAMVFGGQTRAKVLGYLAESSVPQNGYALSKALGMGVSKVYEELKRLESCGVLRSSRDAKGSKQFALNDEDLRRFLVRNVRILPADEWLSPAGVDRRRRSFEEAKRIAIDLPTAPTRAGVRPFAKEFRRPPEKDRALDRVKKAAIGRR